MTWKPKLKTLEYRFLIHTDGFKLDPVILNKALQEKYGYHFYIKEIECLCDHGKTTKKTT